MKKMIPIAALILICSVVAEAQADLKTIGCSGEINGKPLTGSAQVTPFGPAKINLGEGVVVEIQQPSFCGTRCQTTRTTTVKYQDSVAQSSLSFSTQDVESSKLTFPGVSASLAGKAISVSCSYEQTERKDGTVDLNFYQDGLYPAPIEAHVKVSTAEAVLEQIQSECGSRPVSALSLKVDIKNNKTPGTASLQFTGEAVCP